MARPRHVDINDPILEGAAVEVKVDSAWCQGHTLCAMIAPESFELDDVDGHAQPTTTNVAPEHQDRVFEAASSCPEQAITITAVTITGADYRTGPNGVAR